MNQYIITESLVKEVSEILERADRQPTKYALIKLLSSHPHNPQADRDCPVCGGGLMCHRWCIDRDCGWDSIKEHRQSKDGEQFAGGQITSHPSAPGGGLTMESKRDCIWTEDDDGIYQTSCLHSFEFMDGTPELNGMKFCPYCGNLILNPAELGG